MTTNLVDEILNATDSPAPTPHRRGRPETDKERIDRQQAVINGAFGAGTVGEKKQYYPNGHQTDNRQAAKQQAAHSVEFDRPAHTVVEELVARVEAEKRVDHVMTAREIADGLKMNGKLTLMGKPVRMHAVEQMLYRCEAGDAVKYVRHLRAHIANSAGQKHTPTDAELADFRAEKARLFDTIRHEVARAGEKKIQLRTREGSVQDIYAAVGTEFGKADFPAHAANLVAQLGSTPARYIYDHKTTSWDVRAEIYTPTPAALHKVGEPLKGGVSVRGNDRGGTSIKTGGYLVLVRCCNYSLYSVDVAKGRRAHRGRRVAEAVAVDVGQAVRAIDVMCDAFGIARTRHLPAPKDFGGTDRELVAAAFRGAMRDGGALAGVVPGRTSALVEEMLHAFDFERRNQSELILADLQQAVTRISQQRDPELRAEIDAAAGAWLTETLGVEDAPIALKFL